ncbi:MAG: hypothetical protein D6698_01000 [Gammaproteobacteria bacterium]|nr:MAG: hypothetical protein D6698_01000 [Gammaproteobacteria bacterium]
MGGRNQKPATPLLLIGVGTMLTSMSVVGLAIGYGLDYWLDTGPWFMLSFGVLGFVGGFLKVYKLLVKLS